MPDMEDIDLLYFWRDMPDIKHIGVFYLRRDIAILNQLLLFRLTEFLQYVHVQKIRYRGMESPVTYLSS